MKIYLVRHGESEKNAGESGLGDNLTKIGIEQAKRLGLFLKNKHIDHAYCSHLSRAKETLKNIMEFMKNVPVTYTKEVSEIHTGVYEDKTQRELEDFRRESLKKGMHFAEIKPDMGESLLDLEKRAQNFLESVKNNHKNKDHILIVSHSGYIRVLTLRLLKLPLKEIIYFKIHNASLSTFELDKNFNVKDFEIDDFKHLLKYSSYKREVVDTI